MPKLTKKLPSYRLHKVSGHAVVTIGGRDHYLGLHGSAAAAGNAAPRGAESRSQMQRRSCNSFSRVIEEIDARMLTCECSRLERLPVGAMRTRPQSAPAD